MFVCVSIYSICCTNCDYTCSWGCIVPSTYIGSCEIILVKINVLSISKRCYIHLPAIEDQDDDAQNSAIFKTHVNFSKYGRACIKRYVRQTVLNGKGSIVRAPRMRKPALDLQLAPRDLVRDTVVLAETGPGFPRAFPALSMSVVSRYSGQSTGACPVLRRPACEQRQSCG